MKKCIVLIGGLASAVAVLLAPAANAAPSGGKHNPNVGVGGGNVGAYPVFSTINCDGSEIAIYQAGGDNPTDSSKCPTPSQ